jgi:hypothetical protein
MVIGCVLRHDNLVFRLPRERTCVNLQFNFRLNLVCGYYPYLTLALCIFCQLNNLLFKDIDVIQILLLLIYLSLKLIGNTNSFTIDHLTVLSVKKNSSSVLKDVG